MQKLLNAGGLAALVIGIASAQTPTFEVIAIRPTSSDTSLSSTTAQLPQCISPTPQVDPGRFTATNITVYRLITLAYGIRYSCFIVNDFGILSGGPAWMLSERFDVQATIPAGAQSYSRQDLIDAKAPELQARLQNLLAERFGLSLRRDKKEMSVYTLAAAPGGLKIPPSVDDEPQRSRLGVELNQDMELLMRVIGNKASMDDFSHLIEGVTQRPVLDRTDFQGDFRFDLRFAGIVLQGQNPAQRVSEAGTLDRFPEATRPTIFRVLEEQLGLKLEATRGVVDIWVIDRVERPSAN